MLRIDTRLQIQCVRPGFPSSSLAFRELCTHFLWSKFEESPFSSDTANKGCIPFIGSVGFPTSTQTAQGRCGLFSSRAGITCRSTSLRVTTDLADNKAEQHLHASPQCHAFRGQGYHGTYDVHSPQALTGRAFSSSTTRAFERFEGERGCEIHRSAWEEQNAERELEEVPKVWPPFRQPHPWLAQGGSQEQTLHGGFGCRRDRH